MYPRAMKALPILATTAAALLASCGGQEATSGITVGAILDLTGPAASYGEDNRRGLQIAEEYINEQGGVLGQPLKIVIEDSRGDPANAVALARRFAGDPRIPTILGPTRTGATNAVAAVVDELAIPVMSVGSTGVLQNGFGHWLFRSTRNDAPIVPALLAFARDSLRAQSIAILRAQNDDWAESITEVYLRAAQDLGLSVVTVEAQQTGALDYKAQLRNIQAKHSDLLILNLLASDAPLAVKQARDMGIETPIMGTAAFTNPSTWAIAGPEAMEGIIVGENYFVGQDRPLVRDFRRRFNERFGVDPSGYSAYAFDGALLVAEAIRQAGTIADRSAIRDRLANMRNFEGLLGSLSYSGPGDATKDAVILKIHNNALSLAR